MLEYTVKVEGMACAMCEAHINEAVRRAFRVRKVTSSRARGETRVLTEAPLDEEALRRAIQATGYRVGAIRVEPCRRKGLFFFGR